MVQSRISASGARIILLAVLFFRLFLKIRSTDTDMIQIQGDWYLVASRLRLGKIKSLVIFLRQKRRHFDETLLMGVLKVNDPIGESVFNEGFQTMLYYRIFCKESQFLKNET